MQRYFIELSYNGENFFGWQRQPNEISVQEVIETQLSKLQSNAPVKVVGCGRTDTGVHANHYILHVDLSTITDIKSFKFKLNCMLPESIAVSDIYPVEQNKHARFDARNRTYRYFIHKNKDPFIDGVSWLLFKDLDIDKMNAAANLLLGKKDFTSLSKIHTDVKTNICDVRTAMWHKTSDDKYYFEISADRFLRNMVRATVGTLIDVGLGKISPSEITTILEAKNRQAASSSVPAHGLFLWEIEY